MRSRPRRQPFRRRLVKAGVFLCTAIAAVTARADHLAFQPITKVEVGHQPVEELSYEAIIEPSSDYDATLRIRVALHNSSALARDVLMTVALPQGAELRGAKAASAGEWAEASPTHVAATGARRDPGTVYVRGRPFRPDELPAAEVVAFAVPSNATVQVELEARVHPELVGGRWRIELPSRSQSGLGLAKERRILVRTPGGDIPSFWVDDGPNRGSPTMLTRGEQPATVEWPATLTNAPGLHVHYESRPDRFGGGEFRLVLRLGPTRPPRPDHLTFVVDRSRSTSPGMQKETQRLITGILDLAEPELTYDVVGFARSATPLVAGDQFPGARDVQARAELQRALDANARDQGTNVAKALALAGERLRDTGARRPMIVVVTDGMLPTGISIDDIRHTFEATWDDGKRPEVLFIVDEPMLRNSGLTSDHPVARLAAALGARISLQTLAQVQVDTLDVLASPTVLGELSLELPESMNLQTPAPPGLVAGTVAVLDGTYQGRARNVKVRGRLADKRIARTVRPQRQSTPAQAFVAVVDQGDQGRAASEGYTQPSWYGSRDQRLAEIGIAQASRGYGVRKGHIDRHIVRHYLRTRVLPRARVCYNRALARNQVQQGRVVLEIEVGKGEVMLARTAQAKLEFTDEDLVHCLTEAGWSLDIPAAKLDDEVYLVRYPLTLVPPVGGKKPALEDPLGTGTVELLLRSAPRR